MATNDKIFNNSFDSPDFELNDITFDLDPNFKDNRDEEIKIHFDMIATKIHSLIEGSRFKSFNKVDDLGRCTKLKKSDINDVYGYISDEMAAKFSRIDLFSELCVYFDINPTKFYSSLSNVYKEDLIQELDKKTGILGKKNINKLF
jgi:ferritin-like protein|tara:strand:+ start:784 stop:1221 length:438 start_codon:yes stop_codon:yes gene_type:complete